MASRIAFLCGCSGALGEPCAGALGLGLGAANGGAPRALTGLVEAGGGWLGTGGGPRALTGLSVTLWGRVVAWRGAVGASGSEVSMFAQSVYTCESRGYWEEISCAIFRSCPAILVLITLLKFGRPSRLETPSNSGMVRPFDMSYTNLRVRSPAVGPVGFKTLFLAWVGFVRAVLAPACACLCARNC